MVDLVSGVVFFVSAVGILALVVTGLGVVVNKPTRDAVRDALGDDDDDAER